MGKKRRSTKSRPSLNKSTETDGGYHSDSEKSGCKQPGYASVDSGDVLWHLYFVRTKLANEFFVQQLRQTALYAAFKSMLRLLVLFFFRNRMNLQPDPMDEYKPKASGWIHTLLNWCLIIPKNETIALWAPRFLKISVLLSLATCLLSYSCLLILYRYEWYHVPLDRGHVKNVGQYALHHRQYHLWMRKWRVVTVTSYIPVMTALASWFRTAGLVMSYSFGRFITFSIVYNLVFPEGNGIFHEAAEMQAELQKKGDDVEVSLNRIWEMALEDTARVG